MYTWKNLDEFVDLLYKNILYNDNKLIAIDKPWGVGIHLVNKKIYKQNQLETLIQIPGQPRFSIDNALDKLKLLLNVNDLKVIKTIDKYSSGIILLGTSDSVKEKLEKTIQKNKCFQIPFLTYHCITQGYPLIRENQIKETCVFRLKNLDDEGFKEVEFLNKTKINKLKQEYRNNTELKILAKNQIDSASYLEVKIQKNKFNFVRAYCSNKCSFILGDIRFSSNIKTIFGKTVLDSKTKSTLYDRFEPLNENIKKKLCVESNFQVPLMLHLKSFFLKDYIKKNEDLLITCKDIPEHFQYALQKLDLDI